MSDVHDDFLKDLQKQCLVDSQEYVDMMVEALAQLPGSFAPVLKSFAKGIHSLKGNMQVSGYLDFAGFLHAAESAILPIDEGLQNPQMKIEEGDERALEFFLSDLQSAVTRYIDQIKSSETDKPEYALAYRPCLTNLEQWWASVCNLPQPLTSVHLEGAHQLPEEIDTLEKETVPLAPGPIKVEIEKHSSAPTETEFSRKAQQVASKSLGKQEEVKEIVKDLYLLFRVGKSQYALDVNHVVEIVTRAPIVRLPVSRSDVRGLVNLRGETVPVLSLENVLGPLSKPQYLVICEKENISFSFEVEDAHEVMSIDSRTLMALPLENRKDSEAAVTQVAQIGERRILMFDLPRSKAA